MRNVDGLDFGLNPSGCFVLIAAMAVCLVQAGCRNNTPLPTASVSGTVKTEDGKVISNGRIMFGPLDANSDGLSGKLARGNIDENGKFVLTTYNNGDGAVVGRHRVALKELSNFDDELIEEHGLPPKHGHKISPEFAEVEIVSGKNFFEFIAIPRSKEESDD